MADVVTSSIISVIIEAGGMVEIETTTKKQRGKQEGQPKI